VSELPAYNGYDPRAPQPKTLGLQGAIDQFIAEMDPGLIALNLGCGQSPLPGFKNVDWMPEDGVDIVCNLFQPNWPIADDSVGFVYMSHLLEHVPPHVWATFWNEIYRVCADGARFMVMSPHGRSDRHMGDPTHCQPLIDRKFAYLNKKVRTDWKLNHNYYGGRDLNFVMDIAPWKLWNQRTSCMSDAAKRDAEICEYNVIDDQIWFGKCFKSDDSQAAYTRMIEAQAQGQLISGEPVE
jgi:hypothetical protein